MVEAPGFGAAVPLPVNDLQENTANRFNRSHQKATSRYKTGTAVWGSAISETMTFRLETRGFESPAANALGWSVPETTVSGLATRAA